MSPGQHNFFYQFYIPFCLCSRILPTFTLIVFSFSLSICEFQKVADLLQRVPSLPFVHLNVGGSLCTPLRDSLKASTFFEDFLAEVERGRIKLPTNPRYFDFHLRFWQLVSFPVLKSDSISHFSSLAAILQVSWMSQRPQNTPKCLTVFVSDCV